MITHLDRFKAAMNRCVIDRVPCGFSASPEMIRELERYTGATIEQLMRAFDVDMRGVHAKYVGNTCAAFDDGTYTSVWGVRMKKIRYGHGEYEEAVAHPLADMESVSEIEGYAHWLTPEDYDYTSVANTLTEFPDDPFIAGYLSIGWFAWQLRGMEKHLEDLLIDTKMADAVIDKIGAWGLAYFDRLLSANRAFCGKNLVAIHLADDMGMQEGPMISPELYVRYYKPWYRKICDVAHRYGVLVEFHSCGSVYELIPELIDTGIDILNPLQTSARNMDPLKIRQAFGSDIAFSGGIDAQQVLPFYTADAVRDEVNRLLDVMSGAGYIMQPGHSIQLGTPPENVLAMYRTLYEYYGLAHSIEVKAEVYS